MNRQISFVMTIAMLGSPAWAAAEARQTPVMTVGGYAVEDAKFRWCMDRQRAQVFRQFSAQGGLTYGETFWQTPCGETTPAQSLLDKTVAVLKRDKCEQLLFKELGLLDDVSWTAFLKRLEQGNAQRQETVRKGGIVYGPVSFTSQQFYDHTMARLRIQAQDRLALKEFDLSDKALRAWYDANQKRFAKSAAVTANKKASPAPAFDKIREQVRSHYLDAMYETYLQSRIDAAKVTRNDAAAMKILKRETSGGEKPAK